MYEGVSCAFEGCDKQAVSRGLCNGHIQQVARGTELRPLGQRPPKVVIECKEDGCSNKATHRGWCNTHYRQFLRGGSTKPIRVSEGRYVDELTGYVYIRAKGHPESSQRGWGLEHRIVMSDHHGRALFPQENVHHINGVKDDNRVKNLELWDKTQPPGQRVTDKLSWAQELMQRYSQDPLFKDSFDLVLVAAVLIDVAGSREAALKYLTR